MRATIRPAPVFRWFRAGIQRVHRPRRPGEPHERFMAFVWIGRRVLRVFF